MPFAAGWKPTAVLVVLGLPATATIAPLQGLIPRRAGSAPASAVTADVGALDLGAAAGAALVVGRRNDVPAWNGAGDRRRPVHQDGVVRGPPGLSPR
ncbi:hypothetical protein ACFY3N_11195 [Streptomyces sp. NPDC000348]|uniref:hypothetical protein n=1 Tax=Streptomyces sp. NPDC000348 TaxID=3364538 RepID=UPI0036A2CE78